jgi:hypothetical protein
MLSLHEIRLPTAGDVSYALRDQVIDRCKKFVRPRCPTTVPYLGGADHECQHGNDKGQHKDRNGLTGSGLDDAIEQEAKYCRNEEKRRLQKRASAFDSDPQGRPSGTAWSIDALVRTSHGRIVARLFADVREIS